RDVSTTVLIPWVGAGGGFVLSGPAWKDDDASLYARQGEYAHDYMVTSHLVVRGENWKAIVRVIRTIDAKCLKDFSYDFAESAMHTILHVMVRDIRKVLANEAALSGSRPYYLNAPNGQELDHYLFRCEQALAVRCHVMDSDQAGALSNPAEILDGLIHLCLQNPDNLPSRMVLYRVLKGLNKKHPKLVASFNDKVRNLQKENPIAGNVGSSLSGKLKALTTV
ncbi:MAG: hypothetical protein F6K19_47825, partial [Cyanothece sp. SIO1E1]|nr:hypothetical protein [Cyanothece sp. SIO1E1]